MSTPSEMDNAANAVDDEGNPKERARLLMATYIEGLVNHSITNPTADAVLLHAPQLTQVEAEELVASLTTTGARRYFYGPGTMFLGAYHRYVLTHPYRGKPVLYRAGCGHLDRLTRSNAAATEIEQAQRACQFAETAFGVAANDPDDDGLLRNEARAVMRMELVSNRKTPMTMTCGLLVDYRTLEGFKNEPLGEHLDDVIIHTTLFRHEADEMTGDRATHYAYFCGLCGAGLHGNVCSYCRHQYAAELARPITSFPIPYRMAGLAMLEYKHEFQYDPRLARVTEYRNWIERTLSEVTSNVPSRSDDMGHERYLRIDS